MRRAHRDSVAQVMRCNRPQGAICSGNLQGVPVEPGGRSYNRSSSRFPSASTAHCQPAGNQLVATVSVTSAGPLKR